ncbi:MAG: hypothetical protein ACYC2K_04020 [Gemmatimonadales bacterium]
MRSAEAHDVRAGRCLNAPDELAKSVDEIEYFGGARVGRAMNPNDSAWIDLNCCMQEWWEMVGPFDWLERPPGTHARLWTLVAGRHHHDRSRPVLIVSPLLLVCSRDANPTIGYRLALCADTARIDILDRIRVWTDNGDLTIVADGPLWRRGEGTAAAAWRQGT